MAAPYRETPALKLTETALKHSPTEVSDQGINSDFTYKRTAHIPGLPSLCLPVQFEYP